MREDKRLGERMIRRHTIIEEGRCGNNKRGSKRLKGSKREQKEEGGISLDDERG